MALISGIMNLIIQKNTLCKNKIRAIYFAQILTIFFRENVHVFGFFGGDRPPCCEPIFLNDLKWVFDFNWCSLKVSTNLRIPTLTFLETVRFFDLSNAVAMGVVISFRLLAPNLNTVSFTLPCLVSLNFLTISSVIYVLWLLVFIRTLVISDFDWSQSIASINTVCIMTLSAAVSTDCLSSQSSTKGRAVLALKMLLNGGFFYLNSL